MGVRSRLLCVLIGASLVGAPSVPAAAAPDDETIWEAGIVTGVADGDTLTAKLMAGPGMRGDRRIRTIGVQAPEVAHSGSAAQCGAAQAKARLKAQLDVGARVQTRSVDVRSRDQYSGGRINRSLYAQDSEGNWYDTSRGTVSQGWMMWFPLAADSRQKAEWAHNLEYRVLADDAFAQKRGLWSANLCKSGRYPQLNVRIWAKYWGTEQVWIENRASTTIDLSGWVIRDAGINAYRRLPAGTRIGPGQAKLVFTGDLNLNNLPTDNEAFEGDAVYLLEPAGNGYSIGALRAWFPYPCNPDDCSDPLRGKVTLGTIRASAPPEQVPSAPGAVRAFASADGSGRVTVSWAASRSPGSDDMTYSLVTRAVDNGAAPGTLSKLTGTSHVVSGLTLGRGYTFTVQAVNGKGRSKATEPTAPVSPIGLAGGTTAPTVDVRGASAVVSWYPAARTPGEPSARYDVLTTTAGKPGPRCATTDGAASCALVGLTVGRAYQVTVRVTLGGRVLTSAPTSFTAAVPPAPAALAPQAPTAVHLQAGDGRAMVVWRAPDSRAGGPVGGYTATVTGSTGHTAACSTTGPTSCIVTGLTNSVAYSATVTARRSGAVSAPSARSVPATPLAQIRARQAGPTAAPASVADPWIGGETVELVNVTDQAVRLGGYGLWDHASADQGGDERARYLFGPEQSIPARSRLLVHLGRTPDYLPPAPAGASWLWTGAASFVNATGDYVELANLNRAQIACATTPGGTCRGTRPDSISSPPVGVTARSTPQQVTVTWGAPISRGGLVITRYTATAYDAAVGGKALGSCQVGGNQRSCSIPGRIGTTYFVDVVATNAQGASGPSWRVRAAPRTVPGAPPRVQVASAPGGLRVQWGAAPPNGAAVTTYTASAHATATGGAAVSTCTTSTGSINGCTLAGLTGGARYWVQVRATNRAGAGRVSSPRVAGIAAVGQAVSSVAGSRIAVRWDDAPMPGSATLGFTATVFSKAVGGTRLGSCVAGPAARGCTTPPLRAQSRYYIELTTRTMRGHIVGRPRLVTGAARKPGAPAVSAVAVAPGRRIVARWRPGDTGFLPLGPTQAGVFRKSSGGALVTTCAAATARLTCATGALPRGTYHVAVRTANAKGWSAWSKRVRVVVR